MEFEKVLTGGMMGMIGLAIAMGMLGLYTSQGGGAGGAAQGYTCPYCGETFATFDELVNHINAQHPDKPPIQTIDITWE